MRWLPLLLLLACRTQPFELLDGGETAADLSQPVDLSHSSGDPCSPKVPDGVCPPNTTCCPFSCWGGNDVTGWCAPGNGCPVC
jgi:hypothetical protein